MTTRLSQKIILKNLTLAFTLWLVIPAGLDAAWPINQTIEAESGVLFAPVNSYGGGTAHIRQNNNCTSGPDVATCGKAEISFTVTDSAQYKFEARVQAPNTSRNSWYFEIQTLGGTVINDTGGVGWGTWHIDVTSGYQTRYLVDGEIANTDGNARIWNLAAGNYKMVFYGRENNCRLDYINIRKGPSGHTPTFTPTIAPTPVPLGNGLCGKYYNDMTLTNLTGTQTDSSVDFNWGAGSPAYTGNNNFSISWTGELEPPSTGLYQFCTLSDDGVRLWVADNLLIDRWVNQSATEHCSGPLWLTMGAKVNIKLDYFENNGQARVHLYWEGPGILKEIIPQGRLYDLGCVAPSPTISPTVTLTPLIPPTPTVTPTPVLPVYQGLNPARRLYGMEYIPFPEQIAGSDQFYGLAEEFLNASAADRPKNTARWRISFKNLTLTVGTQISVETRIGPHGVSCTTGLYYAPNYSSTTELSLPPRPQNLSTTYFWLDNAEVPFTERYDTMGDPRYVPYLDMMGHTSTSPAYDFANNYNWFFKDLRDTSHADYQGAYRNFVPEAIFNRYNNQPNKDVPKMFQLWREGIIASRSIYTSMTGYTSYYIGVGGEIGGDAANQLNGGVPISGRPWGGGGSSDRDEITGSASLIRSTTSSWRSLPFLGELFPDYAYNSDWSSANTIFGNLRNQTSGGDWRRDAWQNCSNSDMTFLQIRHRTADHGCATFLNGNGGSNTFNHFSEDRNATLMYDASIMAQDYHFAMPATFPVNRPFGLNRGGNQPNEWNRSPYNNNRAMLEIYSASSQPLDQIGFYRRAGGNHERSSAALRAYLGSKQQAGWFIINGLAPSTETGFNFVARFALLSCLRVFHDAGAPTATAFGSPNFKNMIGTETFRIEPVPFVQITKPSLAEDTRNRDIINLEWKQRYTRWDTRRYTENYPRLDVDDPLVPSSAHDSDNPGDPAREWQSSEPLVFQIIYSPNGGVNWYSALSNISMRPGIFVDTEGLTNTGFVHTYNWDVSSLDPGNKLLRVEAYRQNIPQHYSYNEMSLLTNP
jgi:hypothetical protein